MPFSKTPAAKIAKQELLRVHAYERDAHLACDLEAMMVNQAEEFTAVVDGGIRVLTGTQMREIFVGAFKDATYHMFDDLEAPHVHVSDDASLAWMAVRIRVRKTQTGQDGVTQERRFVSTAIYTYQYRDGRWLRSGSSGSSVDESAT